MADMSILTQRIQAARNRRCEAAYYAPAPVVPVDPNALLTLEQAAEVCHVHKRTLVKWPLPFVKIGRIVRVRRGDLDAYIATKIAPAVPAEQGKQGKESR